MANWTGNTYIDSLLLGTKWSSSNISYYVDNSVYSWSGIEKAALQTALQSWQAVANISFTEVFSAGSANLIEQDIYSSDSGSLASHQVSINYNSSTITGHGGALYGYYNWNGIGWDWQNSNGGLQVGGFGFTTIVHEIGHALGLDHTFSSAGDPQWFPGVDGSPFTDAGDNLLNQDVFSVMSYVHGLWSKPVNGASGADNYGYVAGPMAFDIATIQYLYGAKASHTGNDTYILPSTNNAGAYWTCIWDTGGIDTISHSGSSAAKIDLTAATLDNSWTGGGALSYVDGIYGGFTIANGTVIENATGGSGNDQLYGNSSNNTLTGNAGNDTILGRDGNDTLNGGTGSDTIDGGNGNDWIVATHADGNDTYTGGNGFDILDFSAVQGVVQINELAGIVTGSAGNDTLTDTIEQIIGTNYNDVLSGSHGVNVLDGNGGNDIFFGNNGNDLMRGGAGNDTFYFSRNDGNDRLLGGDGWDILNYSTLPGVVQVNQLAGTTTGTANNDTLLDVFEQVIGSNYDDVLSGGHGINALNGGGGNDQIFCNNGNDWCTGGTGMDTITLGPGNDVFQFYDGDGSDTITDFVAGAGVVDVINLRYETSVSSFADVLAHASQSGANTMIDFGGGDAITLLNVNVSALNSDDFTFV